MKEAWKIVEEWMGEDVKDLHPPATNGEIAWLKDKLLVKLPTPLVEWLKVHNGGDVGGMELLDVKGIERASFSNSGPVSEDDKEHIDYSLDPDFDDEEISGSDKGVRDVWYRRGWIPIATEGGGNYVCIDTDPATGGTYGQVIYVDHEGGGRELLAKSLSAWWDQRTQELKKTGKFRIA